MRWFLSFTLLLGTAGCLSKKNSNSTGYSDPVLNLEIQLSLDGEVVSQPKIMTLSGQSAKIESLNQDGNGVSIEVIPTLQHEDQVHMRFVISTIEKSNPIILSKPQVVSPVGQSARITQAVVLEGVNSLSLSVTPTVQAP